MYLCIAMKLLSLIICTLVLILVAMPSIKLLTFQNVTTESCCNDTCETSSEKENSKQEENCTGSACNPFATCCSCVLYVFSSLQYKIYKPEVYTIHEFIYSSNFKSQFSIDFWQPPKLV